MKFISGMCGFGNCGKLEQRDVVFAESGIARQDGHFFGAGLGDDHAVEWIAVDEWEEFQFSQVGKMYGKGMNTVLVHLLRDEVSGGSFEGELSQASLDQHFPDAGDAEVKLIISSRVIGALREC